MRVLGIIVPIILCFLFVEPVDAQKMSKKEKKQWKKRAKTFKSNPEQLKALFDENKSLKGQIADLKKEVEATDAKISDRDEQIAQYQDQVSSLRSELASMRSNGGSLPETVSDGNGSQPSRTVNRSSGQYSKGVVFRVQIGAFKNKDLTKYNSAGDNFKADQDGDLQRMSLGAFRDYWEADKFKKYLREMGVKDAWIVSYKDNRRVPIKEVLEGVI